MEKIVSLCKRRGFVFQSSEIYGGAASVWDYGPLGVELRKNVADLWWSAMVHARDDIEGLDAGILMHPRVWEASGHVSGFTDPLLECKTCKKRWRADHIEQAGCARKPSVAPGAHADCDLGEPRLFNLMFKTFMGPVEEDASVVFLRPETAQGSYVNFLNVQQTSRQRVPFGIAQLGKAFRNEITPGNFIFRTREFEQAEMQFFVKPGSDDEWFDYWLEQRIALAPRDRHPAGEAAAARPRSERAGALRQDRRRHRVRVPLRLAGAGGRPQPHRLRPLTPPGVFRQAPHLHRSGRWRALPAFCGGNGDGGRPGGPGRAGGRIPRRGGRRAGACRPGTCPAPGSDQGRSLPVDEEARATRAGALAAQGAARRAYSRRLRPGGLDRTPLPAARTRRARRGASPSTARPGTTTA